MANDLPTQTGKSGSDVILGIIFKKKFHKSQARTSSSNMNIEKSALIPPRRVKEKEVIAVKKKKRCAKKKIRGSFMN